MHFHLAIINGFIMLCSFKFGSSQPGVTSSTPSRGTSGRSPHGPASVTVQFVVECGVAHLREFGPPGPAQFANDTIFQGTHVHPEAVGRVGRLCPSPVFVPPRAGRPGGNGAIPRLLAGQGLIPIRARRPERLAGAVAPPRGLPSA